MTFAIKDLTADQLNVAVRTMMVQMRIDDPIEVIRRIISREWVVTEVNPKLPAFPIWKTVTVGNFGNAETACQRLEECDISVGADAENILSRGTFEDTEGTLKLVLVTPKDLGLEYGATLLEVHVAARRCGLFLCPADVGPQLWLQYPDLLLGGESIWLVGGLDILTLRRWPDPYIDGLSVCLDFEFDDDQLLVFKG